MLLSASLNLVWDFFNCVNLNADVCRHDDKPTLIKVRALICTETGTSFLLSLTSKAFHICSSSSTTSNTWHTSEPFYLVRCSVRQQVTPDNLILQPSGKTSPRLTPALGGNFWPFHWLKWSQGWRTSLEGCCHAGCFDGDPENASAALGRQSKQAWFPWGEQRAEIASAVKVAVKGLTAWAFAGTTVQVALEADFICS